MAPVFFEIKDSIGLITLNRPDKLNSFNREMALLLQEKLDECKKKKSAAYTLPVRARLLVLARTLPK